MYCNRCGKQLGDGSSFCSACGTRTGSVDGQRELPTLAEAREKGYSKDGYAENPNDRGGFLWGLLGFICGGLISIILYFIWRKEYPKRAKSVLIGMIVLIVFYVVVFVIFGDRITEWAERQSGTGSGA